MKVIVLKDNLWREYECLVDDDDFERVKKFKWGLHRQKNGHIYVRRRLDRKFVFLHSEIMMPEKGKYVDHKNRNGLDNRRENLRVVTQSENILNSKHFKKKSELPRGVTRVMYKGLLKGYKVQLRYLGICYYLGFYTSMTLAFAAYLKKVKEFGIYNYDLQQ